MEAIGKPVPANLDQMSIDELHAYMESCDGERAAIRDKQLIVKPILDLRHREKAAAQRAGHDLNIVVEGVSPTLEDAKAMLALIGKGVLNAPAKAIQKMQDIVARGK